MENPEAVMRFFTGLLSMLAIGTFLLAVFASFLQKDAWPFLWWILGVLSFVILFSILGALQFAVNSVLFVPLFRVLGKLSAWLDRNGSRSS